MLVVFNVQCNAKPQFDFIETHRRVGVWASEEFILFWPIQDICKLTFSQEIFHGHL